MCPKQAISTLIFILNASDPIYQFPPHRSHFSPQNWPGILPIPDLVKNAHWVRAYSYGFSYSPVSLTVNDLLPDETNISTYRRQRVPPGKDRHHHRRKASDRVR